MSDTRARASRFAFALGSLARNGLIGARGVVDVALTAGRGATGEDDGVGLPAPAPGDVPLGRGACVVGGAMNDGRGANGGGAPGDAPVPV